MQSVNDNGKLYAYMRITTNKLDTKSNPNDNHSTTTTQRAVVSIQLNI